MSRRPFKLLAFSLAAVLLVLPAGVAAQGGTGATVVVTRTDGRALRGELIAVTERSLVVRWAEGGRDGSIDVADIEKVRIVKKSRTFVGALSGLGLAGSLDLINGPTTAEEEAGIAAFIGLCGLVGAAAGTVAGIDRIMPIAGQSDRVVSAHWRKLRARSREARLRKASAFPSRRRAAGPELGAAGPAGTSPEPAPPRDKPRLRLNAALSRLARWDANLSGAGSFRFPGEPPPEAGPYPITASVEQTRVEDAVAGPISLAYEWGDHWAAEMEYSYLGRTNFNLAGTMTFTSSADGAGYRASYRRGSYVRLSAILAGVAFRPIAPGPFQRHALEIGAALGAALVHDSGGTPLPDWPAFSFPGLTKTVPCGRIRAAYDYYLSTAFSIGAFAGYRYLEARYSGLESSALVEFQAPEAAGPPPLARMTTVALPDLAIGQSGIYFGLRLGVRI